MKLLNRVKSDGMGKDKIEIIGYHTTNKKNVDKIIKEKFKLSKNNKYKKHWLGDGIYLFKYPLDAKAWGLKIDNCKENPATIMVKAKLVKEKILDLDNPFDMNKLKDFTEKAYKKSLDTIYSFDFCNEMEIMSLGINLYKEAFDIDLVIYTFSKSMTRGVLELNDFTYDLFRKDRKRRFNIDYNYNQVQYCLTNNSKIEEKKLYKFECC